MLPHQNLHKYTWTSPDRKTHNQIDYILIDRRRWHSSILDVRSFRRADCDGDQYLVAVKLKKRLAIVEQATLKFDVERFNVSGWRLGNSIRLSSQTGLQLLRV
jgi:hypothetical protein